MGPWLLRVIVRALHRHTGYVTWDDVEQIDWDAGTLRLRVTALRRLRPEPRLRRAGRHRRRRVPGVAAGGRTAACWTRTRRVAGSGGPGRARRCRRRGRP